MTYTKTPPTYHVKVPSHYVIATFQLYGSLMLESPDYFFRVREIGRLRQTRLARDTVWRSLALASPTFILTFRLRTCSEGMACSCSAADGDISQESDDSQPGPSKKKAKLTRKYQGSALYSTKYQQAWEKEFAFVCPSKSSNYHFHCKACNKDVSVSHQGILDIQRHAESKMHRLRITSLRAQPTLGMPKVKCTG